MQYSRHSSSLKRVSTRTKSWFIISVPFRQPLGVGAGAVAPILAKVEDGPLNFAQGLPVATKKPADAEDHRAKSPSESVGSNGLGATKVEKLPTPAAAVPTARAEPHGKTDVIVKMPPSVFENALDECTVSVLVTKVAPGLSSYAAVTVITSGRSLLVLLPVAWVGLPWVAIAPVLQSHEIDTLDREEDLGVGLRMQAGFALLRLRGNCGLAVVRTVRSIVQESALTMRGVGWPGLLSAVRPAELAVTLMFAIVLTSLVKTIDVADPCTPKSVAPASVNRVKNTERMAILKTGKAASRALAFEVLFLLFLLSPFPMQKCVHCTRVHLVVQMD